MPVPASTSNVASRPATSQMLQACNGPSPRSVIRVTPSGKRVAANQSEPQSNSVPDT